MSKIGNVNLELQEQANELGFETVQEAVDNGYSCVYGQENGEPALVKRVESTECEHEFIVIDDDKFLEKAHKAWLEEKEKVLKDLDYLLRGYHYTIEDEEKIINVIDFIQKGEV